MDNNNNEEEYILKHISMVKVGDVILCSDGLERTVGKKSFSNGFCGLTIFGDSWRLGTRPVKVNKKYYRSH